MAQRKGVSIYCWRGGCRLRARHRLFPTHYQNYRSKSVCQGLELPITRMLQDDILRSRALLHSLMLDISEGCCPRVTSESSHKRIREGTEHESLWSSAVI